MVEVIWDDRFKTIFKKWVKKHPDLVDDFRERLLLFTQDPFSPSLKTHALHGELKGLYTIRITFQYRLVFGFFNPVKNKGDSG
jgi:mRNA-degrading endonuclease YafQ of YafQ-DinJ toxin-antitoxin module